ncbi:hypothetical protein BLNAU_4483 [Blattamonas nauphoetae]|uniref:Uncharacterized protein n=1 Tax=Blattamonas nauphoetae TaxID=2049346 RepID=A0ABQ9YA34_9EUKA|nr:hypothetical protein BLNAU_4483 [Blattamonas nauphoetae]
MLMFVLFGLLSSTPTSRVGYLPPNSLNSVLLNRTSLTADVLYQTKGLAGPFSSTTFHVFAPLAPATVTARRIFDGKEDKFSPREYDISCNFTKITNISTVFPKKYILDSMENMTGYGCNMTYSMYHSTPGIHNIHLELKRTQLVQLETQYKEEQKFYDKQAQTMKVLSMMDEDDDGNVLKKQLKQNQFVFPIFIGATHSVDFFVYLPFFLLPVGFFSGILVQLPYVRHITLLMPAFIRLLELYAFGISVPYQPNILESTIPTSLLLMKEQAISPRKDPLSFMKETFIPALTRVEFLVPIILTMTSFILPLLSRKRRRDGKEEEGIVHEIWMTSAAIYLTHTVTSRFIKSLNLTSSTMASLLFCGSCDIVCLVCFTFSRNSMRRTEEEEKQLKRKEEMEKRLEKIKKGEKIEDENEDPQQRLIRMRAEAISQRFGISLPSKMPTSSLDTDKLLDGALDELTDRRKGKENSSQPQNDEIHGRNLLPQAKPDEKKKNAKKNKDTSKKPSQQPGKSPNKKKK